MIKWVSIPEYSKQTGLSRASIKQLINENKIISIRTEGNGQVRIRTDNNQEVEEIKKELIIMKDVLIKLCNHLGVKV